MDDIEASVTKVKQQLESLEEVKKQQERLCVELQQLSIAATLKHEASLCGSDRSNLISCRVESRNLSNDKMLFLLHLANKTGFALSKWQVMLEIHNISALFVCSSIYGLELVLFWLLVVKILGADSLWQSNSTFTKIINVDFLQNDSKICHEILFEDIGREFVVNCYLLKSFAQKNDPKHQTKLFRIKLDKLIVSLLDFVRRKDESSYLVNGEMADDESSMKIDQFGSDRFKFTLAFSFVRLICGRSKSKRIRLPNIFSF